ncbi:MAG TPA: PAS domain S-box protein [Vicinamibacterales bacterium]|nr:PAS domain S-box protein [Vicinamibacterales bacterium]
MGEHWLDTAVLLSAIVESSDDAIVSKDLNGIVRSWNRGAERLFGYTADEIIGQSILKIIPEDRLQEEDRVLRSIRAGERVDHFETVRRTRNGSLIPISLTVSPIRDASGRVVGASKIARDISDRKRAEALAEKTSRRDAFLAQVTLTLSRSLDYKETLYRLANTAVPYIADYCAVDIVNEDRVLTSVVVAHADPAKAAYASEVQKRYDDPLSSSSPQQVMRTGVPAFIPRITDEMVVASARGDEARLVTLRSLNLVSYMCVPMIAHAQTLGVLTLANAESRTLFGEDDLHLAEDIAGRAALAIENARSYDEARTANRLKDEFLATLSHELRTPLNAVLGYARMLRSGEVSVDRTANAIEVLERNASALAQMVEDVLDVSRIISGKGRLEVQTIDIGRLVEDAIATVMPSAEAKEISIARAVDAQIGSISADPNRLRQVIWNLLSNAVKFTPIGGRVEVRLRRVDGQMAIVVADSGAGFSSEFRPHLFERFRQAEGGTARRHGGLGLGLAIARHIVEMHGGTIEAVSEGEGKGSTFEVRLPLRAPQLSPSSVTASAPVSGPSTDIPA